jgi:hypothetical protein
VVWSIYYAFYFCSYFSEFVYFLITEDVCVCLYFTDGDIVVGDFLGDIYFNLIFYFSLSILLGILV